MCIKLDYANLNCTIVPISGVVSILLFATGSTGESILGIPGSKGDDGKPGLPGIPGSRGQSGEIGPAGICDSSGGCHRAPQQTGKLPENIN